MTTITTSENKKIYFASDQHLGAPTPEASLPREKKFVAWLDAIKEDAGTVFLLGDLFDFWFEYKTVVPKGFVRVLGKLAELKDAGIPSIGTDPRTGGSLTSFAMVDGVQTGEGTEVYDSMMRSRHININIIHFKYGFF